MNWTNLDAGRVSRSKSVKLIEAEICGTKSRASCVGAKGSVYHFSLEECDYIRRISKEVTVNGKRIKRASETKNFGGNAAWYLDRD